MRFVLVIVKTVLSFHTTSKSKLVQICNKLNSQEPFTSRIELLRFGLEDLADGAVGPAAAHDEEDDGEQCCKKEVS